MSNSNTLFSFSQAFADAAEKAGAGTVLVNARSRFPASGIVYQPDLLLTADHVVEREEEITVVLPGGEELPATLVGRDPGSDLALLRLSEGIMKPAVIANRVARVGELVLALGRPSAGGLQASLGVVSGVRGLVRIARRGRRKMNWTQSMDPFIFTDAVPLPGFSGGPLIDAAGELLGLNTSGLVHGASVAIPMARAFEVAGVLAEHGSIKRGYLGLRSQLIALSADMQAALGREQESGLLVVWAETGSPAAEGGIIVGDILVGIADQAVSDHESLQTALSGDVVGKSIRIEQLS